MCFIEKFLKGPFFVATFARGTGFTGGLLGGEEVGVAVRAVENFEEGIGEVVFGCTGDAANSALGEIGIVTSGASPKEMSIGVKTKPGIFGDCSGTWLMDGGASDR
jgi:hypothetical protein